MALEKTFRELTAHLQKTQEAFKEVQLTVVEDRPPDQDVVMVDHFEYAVDDVLGWLEGALKYAADAEQAVGVPLDLERARRSLGQCQEVFQKLQQRYGSDLISYGQLEALTNFGRKRRGEWQGWVESVKNGLDQCRHPIEEAGVLLARCWQELAERLGSTNVSVHATNIGQQITQAVAGEADGPGRNYLNRLAQQKPVDV